MKTTIEKVSKACFTCGLILLAVAGNAWGTTSYGWLPGDNLPGPDGSIYAMAALKGKVYVGGVFTSVSDTVVNNIACWGPATQTWSALGSGMGGDDPNVYALTVMNDKLYVGGEFTTAGGTTVNRIACWDPDTQAWSALDTGIAGSFFAPDDATVYAMSVQDGKLYVGGYFFNAGDVEVNRVARWDPDVMSWSALPGDVKWTGSGGVGHVYACAGLTGGQWYVGGDFIMPYDGPISYGIVSYDPDEQMWTTFGSGLGATDDTQANAMLFLNGILYMGGQFTAVYDVSASNIASYDPATATWSALGAGIGTGMSIDVHALAAMDGKLYAGGDFNDAGDTEALRVACWNPATQTWSALGSGINNTVRAMTVLDQTLYVGGDFTYAGGSPVIRWARWGLVETGDQADTDQDDTDDAYEQPSVTSGVCGAGAMPAMLMISLGLFLIRRSYCCR